MNNCYRCGEELKPNRLRCLSCGAFNVSGDGIEGAEGSDKSIALCDVVSAEHDRVATGPWDICFGGEGNNYGIVRTSVSLLGGSPGAGKSTLVLQIANQADGEVIYIAAEEALPEIKSRADRLNLEHQKNIRMVSALSGASLNQVIESRPTKPKMIIIDSLQGLVGEDDASQLEICKLSKVYAVRLSCPFLVISHVTKADVLAGRLTLQHAVDTTMTFFPVPEMLGENGEPLRMLDVMKNRFGAARVKCFFEMTGNGLEYTEIGEE